MKKLLYPAIVMILAACSSEPNESKAKTDVSDEIAKASSKKIELTEFKKVNAQNGEIFGVKIYEVEFEGKVKYSDAGFTTNYTYKRTQNSFLELMPAKPNQYLSYKTIKKGQVEDIKGSIAYEKKENGWVPTIYNIFLKNPSVK